MSLYKFSNIIRLLLSGACDNSMTLQLLDHSPLDMYAVAGHDVPMYFKYNRVNIHSTWIVNNTYNLNDTNIIYNSSNNAVDCDEVYHFKLIKVQCGGDFTIYSSTGGYKIHRTIHLSKLVVVVNLNLSLVYYI